MHVPALIPLLAAALVSLIAASASGQQVHLGRPLALEGADAPSAENSEGPAVAATGDELSDEVIIRENDRTPIDAEAAVVESIESNPLGRPQKLLASVRSGAKEADEEAAGLDEGSAGFGGISGDAFQVISAMAVVMGLVFGLRAVLLRGARRMGGGGRPSGVLEILARYPVARGQHLVLLKMARRILLVHQSGPSMTMLSEISDPDEVAALLARIEAGSTSPREASRFRSLLNQFKGEHESAAIRSDHAGISDAWNGGEVVDLTKRSRRGVGGMFSRAEARP